tara:strand:- start:310 stop:984 length:675 start_codon:yes stop_codon:yes gene_type:complete
MIIFFNNSEDADFSFFKIVNILAALLLSNELSFPPFNFLLDFPLLFLLDFTFDFLLLDFLAQEPNVVFDFIKSNYDNKEIKQKYNIIDIIYDKYSGNKRPDIVFICENYVIVIEVDEFQHKHNSQPGEIYSKENEKNKMNLIREHYLKENKKTIYLRFNPDDYLNKNNIKIKSPWEKNENRKLVLINKDDWDNRLRILKQKIDYYLKKEKIKNNSTNYLFYDGY